MVARTILGGLEVLVKEKGFAENRVFGTLSRLEPCG